MLGLDEQIAGLGEGGLAVALVVAVLLGLRHATDPDHLTAVSMLVLDDGDRRGARRAGALGLAWGLGHAVTLVALGLPLVVAGHLLPDAVQRGAEVAIGAVIALLAVRLLVRWRRGYLHSHEHSHGDRTHAHPHFHEHVDAGERAHAAEHARGHAHAGDGTSERRPLAAFGVGLLHGAGGSAGAGLLLVSAMPGEAVAAAALGLLAAGTAVSMAVASAAFGGVLGGARTRRRLESLVPLLGACSLLFGAWYGLGALSAMPYVL